MQPLITVVLAYLILKEKMKKFEIVIMILSIVAIILFSIFGTKADEQSETDIPHWVFYVLLTISPCLSAGGTIAMRKMKKFHEAVVSWYLNWMLLFSSTTMILILQQGWMVFFNFDWISWVLMVGIGVLAVTS